MTRRARCSPCMLAPSRPPLGTFQGRLAPASNAPFLLSQGSSQLMLLPLPGSMFEWVNVRMDQVREGRCQCRPTSVWANVRAEFWSGINTVPCDAAQPLHQSACSYCLLASVLCLMTSFLALPLRLCQ